MKLDGKHVKLILCGDVVTEGIVESWSETEVVLKSLDNKSQLIIPNPSRDIVLIKVSLDLPTSEIDQKFEETLNQPPSDLKHRKLAELRILKSSAEREILATQLRSHEIGEVKKVNYGTPGFFTQSRSK